MKKRKSVLIAFIVTIVVVLVAFVFKACQKKASDERFFGETLYV